MTPTPGRNLRSQTVTLGDLKSLIESVKEEVVNMTKSIDRLSGRVNSIEQRLQTITMEQNDCRQEILDIRKELSNQADKETIMMEIQERLEKRKCLILSGVTESFGENANERHKNDERQVRDLFKSLNIESEGVKEVIRIGKITTGKPRLLRVKCNSVSKRNEILRKSKELKRLNTYKHVYVNPDLTKDEQKLQKALRDELKRRRNLGEQVVIWKNEIRLKQDIPSSRSQNFQV